jgi:hypothetical protein
MNKQEALAKIEELKKFVEEVDNQEEWIKIDYNIIPKEVFDKYGAKPFEIMKRKMRKDGEVWNNINYFDANTEASKIGYRLPTIQEMLVLLDWYKQKNEKVSCYDKEFLGIEELSYDEDVCYEWIAMTNEIGFIRGGVWADGSYAGLFFLNLYNAPSNSYTNIGFRLSRSI